MKTSGLLMLGLVMSVVTCGRGRDSAPATTGSGARRAMRPKVPDSLAEIRPLVDLLRAQLTAAGPRVTERVITCEVLRLEGTFGMAKGEAFVHEAIKLADAPADDSARRRVEAALVGQMFGDAECDSLAKAGALGGPAFPKGAPPP